jgi:hypothetical protein
MTAKPRQPRPGQLRNDPAVQAAIASAFDGVLERRTHHESVVRKLLTRPGFLPDQALVSRMAQEFGARIDRWEGAREGLATTLAAADRARAAETRALTASLEVAIRRRQAAEDGALIASLGQAAEHARKRSLTPIGPIRIPLRLP